MRWFADFKFKVEKCIKIGMYTVQCTSYVQCTEHKKCTNNVYKGFSAALVFLQLMLCQFLEPIVAFEQLENQDSATSHNNCMSALAAI